MSDWSESSDGQLDRRTYMRIATGGTMSAVGALSTGTGLVTATRDPAATVIEVVNRQHVELVREHAVGTPTVMRNSALVNLAMYEVVNAISRKRDDLRAFEHWQIDDDVSGRADRKAVAVAAAETVFDAVYDDRVPLRRNVRFDDVSSLRGIRAGRAFAKRVLKVRATDGFDAEDEYRPCSEDGAGDYEDAIRDGPEPTCFPDGPDWVSSHVAFADPFLLADVRDFRSPPPPRHDNNRRRYVRNLQFTAQYMTRDAVRENRMIADGVKIEGFDLAAYDDIFSVGAFWRGAGGTARPPGYWVLVANELAGTFDQSVLEVARGYTLLTMALADAGISAWDTKRYYGFWRPVHAIHHATDDRIRRTDRYLDPAFRPFASGTFGGSPEYESGQAKFAGTAEVILGTVFDDETGFDLTVHAGYEPPFEEVTRSYDRVSEAVAEACVSRFGAGNHFPFTMRESLESGRELGRSIVNGALGPLE